MSDTRLSFAACYSDWKLIKTRGVVQVVLELPVEKSNEAYEALGGMPTSHEVWCAVAILDLKKASGPLFEEKTNPEPKPKAPRTPVAIDKRLAQRAGILSTDPIFWKYLEHISQMTDVNETEAAAYIRTKCGVESRSEIVVGSEAAEAFDGIQTEFVTWRDADKFVETR